MWWIHEDTYGLSLDALRASGRDILGEIALSTIKRRIEQALRLLDAPLLEPRIPALQTIGNCRDFSLFLVSVLRHRGIPARARTGVARYFYPDGSKFEDHWICEFWSKEAERWQQVDPQIDALIREALGATFDFTDLPSDQFLTGWQCHTAVQDWSIAPERIGFNPEFSGTRYTQYKLFGDLAFVTDDEILPGAGWGFGSMTEPLQPGDAELSEQIVALLRNIDTPSTLREARELMDRHPRLRKPAGYDPGPFLAEWLE